MPAPGERDAGRRDEPEALGRGAAPPPAPEGQWRSEIVHAAPMDPACAMELLKSAMQAVQSIARDRGKRVLFVATGDPRGGGAGGPDSVRGMASDEETAEHLARLASAVGSPEVVKLLQALVLAEERTTAELADAGGATGADLARHLDALHEAHLIYQPGRGRYRLTASGRYAAEMLFWSALQVRRSLPSWTGQGGWYGADDSLSGSRRRHSRRLAGRRRARPRREP